MRTSTKKARGRPRGRTKPHRPVLSARVPMESYARIQTSARTHGRTVSEEIIWLAELGLNCNAALDDANAIREKAFSEANAILAAAEREKAGILHSSNRALVEELLEQAAMRAIEKMKETQS
jgi:hypothetical protein